VRINLGIRDRSNGDPGNKPQQDRRPVGERGLGFGGRRQARQFGHADKPGVKIMVPRHNALSLGVARNIAKAAGW
jgi:hypothetical protein